MSGFYPELQAALERIADPLLAEIPASFDVDEVDLRRQLDPGGAP
jgi:hypothetical protein